MLACIRSPYYADVGVKRVRNLLGPTKESVEMFSGPFSEGISRHLFLCAMMYYVTYDKYWLLNAANRGGCMSLSSSNTDSVDEMLSFA